MRETTRHLLDAFWRAAAYCLHPKVVALSLAPLIVVGGAAIGLGHFYWEPGVDAVRATLESSALLAAVFSWLDAVGAGGLHSFVGPLVVVVLAVPAFVVASLFVVAMLMTPAIVRLVARRRFPHLERRHGGGFWLSLAWSLGCTLAAVFMLVVSVPLWFVPPLVLVLPPLIWGWLTYRVLAFDVLAAHASTEERRRLLRERRWPLLAMGIVAGYLGAAPSLLWAVSAMALVLAPLLILVSIWLYTLVFAFSSLWFAHYLLAALERLRGGGSALAPGATTAGTTPATTPVLGPTAERPGNRTQQDFAT